MELRLLYGAGMLLIAGDMIFFPFCTKKRVISTKSPLSVPSDVMNCVTTVNGCAQGGTTVTVSVVVTRQRSHTVDNNGDAHVTQRARQGRPAHTCVVSTAPLALGGAMPPLVAPGSDTGDPSFDFRKHSDDDSTYV